MTRELSLGALLEFHHVVYMAVVFGRRLRISFYDYVVLEMFPKFHERLKGNTQRISKSRFYQIILTGVVITD